MRLVDDSELLPLGADVWLSLAREPETRALVHVVDVSLDGVTVHDPLAGARLVTPLRVRRDPIAAPTLYAVEV